MKPFRPLLSTAVAAVLSLPVQAADQILPAAGLYTYTQNFDGLFSPAVPGTVTNLDAGAPGFADNSTIPNWWFVYATNTVGSTGVFAGSDFGYSANDGTAAPALTLNSQGAAGSTDRTWASPSTTARGEQAGIVIFRNTSSNGVSLSRIAYSGEVARTNGTAGTVESLYVWYRKAAAESALLAMTTDAATSAVFPPEVSTNPNSRYFTGWTQIPEARWTYTNPNAALPVSESYPVDASLSGIVVAPNEFIAIRFGNINDAGVDGLMGIDDLSIQFTELSVTVSAAASNVQRSDSGTPFNPADDTVSFTLTVNGAGNTSPSGWTIAGLPVGPASGSYGTPVNYNGIPIGAFAPVSHELTATVTDAGTPTATSAVTITAPWCSITASASGFTYTPDAVNGDMVSFIAGATGLYTGPTYTVTGPFGSQSVSYATPTPVTVPAGSTQTLTFTDDADPACTATLLVNVPGTIGTNNLTIPGDRLLSAPSYVSRVWTIDSLNRTTLQNSSTQADHIILSDVVNLSATGAVSITAELDAITGSSSGFEAPDHFRLDLIIDGGEPISMLGAADVDHNGQLDGGEAGSGSELPDAGVINTTISYSFSAVVPSTANSVQVRILGNSNSPNETLLLKNLILSPGVDPIVPGSPTLAANNGAAAKLTAASVAALASGGGGPLTVTAVQSAPTGLGSTVTLDGGWIIYHPAPGASGVDSFSYTISDGSTSVTGTVTVVISVPGGATMNIVGITTEGDSKRVTGMGIPGRFYQWQYSADLTNWEPLAPAAACPENGIMSHLDPGPLPPTRFYRLIEPGPQ